MKRGLKKEIDDREKAGGKERETERNKEGRYGEGERRAGREKDK